MVIEDQEMWCQKKHSDALAIVQYSGPRYTVKYQHAKDNLEDYNKNMNEEPRRQQ